MLTFTKNDSTKLIDPESSLIPVLKADGWKLDGDDGLDELKEKAKELGLKVHHKAKAETIKQMIEEAENDDDSE